MKVSPAGLVAHARSDEGKKQLRYFGVSLIFVPVGQILIQVLSILLNGNFVSASLLNSAILTLPNFFANKIWVWRVTSKDNQRTQIAVFWVAAMLGVSFATGLTYLVQEATKAPAGQDPTLTTRLLVTGAQLTGFGIVWVIRYLVLDKWLFKMTHHGADPAPGEIDDLHGEIPI